MTETNHVLEVEHLSVEYQDSTLFGKKKSFKALSDVSFHVNQGEILGLVGESGCGKSTLSKAILGMLDTAKVEGEIRHFTKRPQMVFQDPFGSLNPAKTIGWILEEPLRIFGKYDEAERKRRVLDMLERVGLQIEETLRIHTDKTPEERYRLALEAMEQVGLPDPETTYKKYPHQLSGGQRQRAIIASAMIIRPKLLICDEPTTALDVTVQKQILDLLRSLSEEYGVGILLISHDMTVVRRLCEQVAVMYKGKIVESGCTEKIFCNPQDEYTKRLIAAIPKRKRHDGNESRT